MRSKYALLCDSSFFSSTELPFSLRFYLVFDTTLIACSNNNLLRVLPYHRKKKKKKKHCCSNLLPIVDFGVLIFVYSVKKNVDIYKTIVEVK